jgi:hypothetical protein
MSDVLDRETINALMVSIHKAIVATLNINTHQECDVLSSHLLLHGPRHRSIPLQRQMRGRKEATIDAGDRASEMSRGVSGPKTLTNRGQILPFPLRSSLTAAVSGSRRMGREPGRPGSERSRHAG